MGSRQSAWDPQARADPEQYNLKSTHASMQTADTTEHYALLGLGRGVDITKQSSWLEKTSFQVRQLTKDRLVETDNGRHLTAHSAEVESRATLDVELKTGVKSANLPAVVDIAAEYTRSYLSRRYIVGTKISNRTISFAQDFEDVLHLTCARHQTRPSILPTVKQHKPDKTSSSQGTSSTAQSSGDQSPEESVLQSIDTQQKREHSFQTEWISRKNDEDDGSLKMMSTAFDGTNMKTFEQRLWEWLLQCRQHHRVCGSESETEYDYRDIDCFIRHFGITHYISAIELGALSYESVTQERYEKSSSVGHSASLDALPHGGLSSKSRGKSTKVTSRKATKELKIGRISGENSVTQSDEAVIGYHINPITCLVKDPYLYHKLKCSIDHYIKRQCTGEVLIMCGNSQTRLYLTVDPKCRELAVTSNRNNAVVFTLKVLNECNSRHNFEFSLASTLTTFKQEQDKLESCAYQTGTESEIPPLEMYLETGVNPVTGKGSHPPRMCSDTNFRKTRLLLKKRVNHHMSGDTQQWRKGQDPFYISCIHRYHNGYLCVEKISTGRENSVGHTSHQHGNDNTERLSDTTLSSPAGSGNIPSNPSVNGSIQMGLMEGDAISNSQSSVETNAAGSHPSSSYRSCIKSSVHYHSEQGHVFMLFWLKTITSFY